MTIETRAQPKSTETIRLTHLGEETNMDLILRFAYDDAGAPALEYAIILAILGVGLMSGISAIGGALNSVFLSISGAF
jgi:Flp pilus assembly pilin Flp